jgi:tRNA(fMet)-specific endonuclease VapC
VKAFSLFYLRPQRPQELRSLRQHIGTLDLRIAATALVHDLTLVTRNQKDFSRVPGLRFEDWSAG